MAGPAPNGDHCPFAAPSATSSRSGQDRSGASGLLQSREAFSRNVHGRGGKGVSTRWQEALSSSTRFHQRPRRTSEGLLYMDSSAGTRDLALT